MHEEISQDMLLMLSEMHTRNDGDYDYVLYSWVDEKLGRLLFPQELMKKASRVAGAIYTHLLFYFKLTLEDPTVLAGGTEHLDWKTWQGKLSHQFGYEARGLLTLLFKKISVETALE